MLSIRLPAESLRCETLFYIDYVAEKKEVYCKDHEEWEHSRQNKYISERKNHENEFPEIFSFIPFLDIILFELHQKLSDRIPLCVSYLESDSIDCDCTEDHIEYIPHRDKSEEVNLL